MGRGGAGREVGGPFVKMPLLTALGLAVSHALAALAKVTPGLRRIL